MDKRKLTIKPKKKEAGPSLDVRIPGVAGLLWFIFFVISMLLIAVLDYFEASDLWIVG